MDIESVKVLLQAAALLAVVIGLGFTLYQVRLLRLSYVDLHDWNRRKAAQDAVERIEVISKDTPLLNEKFKILTESNPIPLRDILPECESNGEVRMALNRRLNYFQSLAGGIQQGVFDEEIVRHSYENVFRRTYNQFKEYIEHRRDIGGRETWWDFINTNRRWESDREPPPRVSTGSNGIPQIQRWMTLVSDNPIYLSPVAQVGASLFLRMRLVLNTRVRPVQTPTHRPDGRCT